MRGIHSHPTSVGVECGDPDLITTPEGGTLADPCPESAFGSGMWCNIMSSKQWVTSASSLHTHVQNAWELFEVSAVAAGTSTGRLQGVYDSLMSRYKRLPKEGDMSEVFANDNLERVRTIQAWMTDATCTLSEIERALRVLKITPPKVASPSSTPGTGAIPGTAPSGGYTGSKPFTQKIGQGVLWVMGIGLVGGSIWLYKQRKSPGLGKGPKRPLPRAK